jgi:flagellar hook-basal body complex protein FliE
MSDLGVAGIGGARPMAPSVREARPTDGFGQALRAALGTVNELQSEATRAAEDFSLGRTQDVASTLITIEKASLGFQLALQVRNRLLEAYQEILRMPL